MHNIYIYIYIYTLRERERQRANYAYISIYIQECVFSNKTADVDVTNQKFEVANHCTIQFFHVPPTKKIYFIYINIYNISFYPGKPFGSIEKSIEKSTDISGPSGPSELVIPPRSNAPSF